MENNKMYEAEIKVNRWNKVIKINEEGDTITINVGDSTLVSRFLKLLHDIQNVSKEISEQAKINPEDSDALLNSLELIEEKQNDIISKIDEFFGKDTCYKIFKTNTPHICDIIDFMFQMYDIIEKFSGQKLDSFEAIQNRFINKQKTRRKI